jgi:hypothetical protein
VLAATEYHMPEQIPLHRIHSAIFDFCRNRAEVVIFGAQAVNVLVDQVRMTQDVDLLSLDPRGTAEALAEHLQMALHIAARVREARPGVGYRVYQATRDGGRHLADVRLDEFTAGNVLVREGLRYTPLLTTVAMKVVAFAKRRMAPKGATDLADLRRLLLSHPELRREPGRVDDTIRSIQGDATALDVWQELLQAPAVSDEDVDEGY